MCFYLRLSNTKYIGMREGTGYMSAMIKETLKHSVKEEPTGDVIGTGRALVYVQ